MYYLLKWIKFSVKKIKHLKNTGKWKKILEKSGKSQGILSARKSGNPGLYRIPHEIIKSSDYNSILMDPQNYRQNKYIYIESKQGVL